MATESSLPYLSSVVEVDLLLSKQQLHIAALADRFAALQKAEVVQKEKLIAKAQEIALLKVC